MMPLKSPCVILQQAFAQTSEVSKTSEVFVLQNSARSYSADCHYLARPYSDRAMVFAVAILRRDLNPA
jgi:hypothetical protein